MKISKFPLFSLILLGGATIYAFTCCDFIGAKVLLDGRSKDFIQNTLTTFLNDPEKAKALKVSEFPDESLMQMQDLFKSNFGRCEFKDISMLDGFQIRTEVNSLTVTKTYTVTVDCEQKKDYSFVVTTRQKNDEIKYYGMKGDF